MPYVILSLSVYISNGYEVNGRKATWIDAAATCTQLNGTLVEPSVTNGTPGMAMASIWTGKFSFRTKWVELKGTYIH